MGGDITAKVVQARGCNDVPALKSACTPAVQPPASLMLWLPQPDSTHAANFLPACTACLHCLPTPFTASALPARPRRPPATVARCSSTALWRPLTSSAASPTCCSGAAQFHGAAPVPAVQARPLQLLAPGSMQKLLGGRLIMRCLAAVGPLSMERGGSAACRCLLLLLSLLAAKALRLHCMALCRDVRLHGFWLAPWLSSGACSHAAQCIFQAAASSGPGAQVAFTSMGLLAPAAGVLRCRWSPSRQLRASLQLPQMQWATSAGR